ncbi:UNVERIFIED_CONTAM: hypothetical protein Slati_0415600 [Sesamum latifolium]|uniref:RNase H type-1 domain-containing protein n=1 Tax=Sesamum latifolium TaxID=2727402 RepID=A0AAW2XV89_9LAMI
MAKGGLRVRGLTDYVRAFSMKLWWRFRLRSSLWSEFLHGRYCRALHPTLVPYNRNHSPVWHRLCYIREVAEPFIFWALGNGAASFWHDNWFGEKTLAQLVHRESYTMEPVRYYWHEGEWNVPKIFRTVSAHIAQVICQIPIAAGQDDKIVWTRSSDEVFSTRVAWEIIQNRIPVDARMKQKGFSFPSKCQCCEAEETIPTPICGEHGSAGGMLRNMIGCSSLATTLSLRFNAIFGHWQAGVGGIQDAEGQVGLAYQVALGTTTSVIAELTAVWHGLELGMAHGLAPIVVEVDATTVIQLLQSRASGRWEVQHLIMRIVQIQQVLGSDVRHIFREANGAADHLAKKAASLQMTRVLHPGDITGALRGIICLDRLGIPHLRHGR